MNFPPPRGHMGMEDLEERLSFLGRTVPAAFEVAFVPIPPGGRRDYDPAEWRAALVVVEHGELELECQAGGRRRFASGAVLWLTGLPLRALHNPGSDLVLLASVRRRGDETDEFAVGRQLYL